MGTGTQAIARSLAHGQKAESVPHTELQAVRAPCCLLQTSSECTREPTPEPAASGHHEGSCWGVTAISAQERASRDCPMLRVTLTNGAEVGSAHKGPQHSFSECRSDTALKLAVQPYKNAILIFTHAGYYIVRVCFLVLKFIFTKKTLIRVFPRVLCGYIVQLISQY